MRAPMPHMNIPSARQAVSEGESMQEGVQTGEGEGASCECGGVVGGVQGGLPSKGGGEGACRSKWIRRGGLRSTENDACSSFS